MAGHSEPFGDKKKIIDEFDAGLWGNMVKFVTVGRNKEITSPSGTGRRYGHNGVQKSLSTTKVDFSGRQVFCCVYYYIMVN